MAGSARDPCKHTRKCVSWNGKVKKNSCTRVGEPVTGTKWRSVSVLPRVEHEAFHRLARRMFATRLVEKHFFADPTLRLTSEQIETVLWESERFAVFPVVFDPTGIATLARVSLRQGVKKESV